MQVQPVQSSMYNPHANPSSGSQYYSQTNGHPPTRQHSSTSTNGRLEEGEMNPYQYNNPYTVGPGQGQPQQRQQYQANQLPPMYAGASAPPMAPPLMAPPSATGMPGQGGNAQPALYPADPAANQFPGPGQSRLNDAPKSQVGTNGKYKFELVVEQQPKRARMCGFGDKDRRPITPPPCVRLIITDARTGKNIAPGDEMDGMFFVLQVDLWDESATREVNIVRSSSASPSTSISLATTTSFPPTPIASQPMGAEYPSGLYRAVEVPQPYGQPGGYNPVGMGQPPMGGQGYSNYPSSMGYYAPTGPQYAASTFVPAPYQSPNFPPPQPVSSHNMYTRNLIGSLTVNASQLKDTNEETGFWFVLQDLSIRTEGVFRLRCNFIDVGLNDGSGQLNKSKAPVLAFVFSDSFQVFSAKRFPGVIESTPLSKKFAQQGIKIPIRKEAKGGRDDDDDDAE